ncbi:hypothetical protein ACFXKF_26840 [Streptomyces scopuliridis]|uniref:hypothetical protein n=1 Tax=Streptomyces scopuliridis TaxID=452529 RepID=UPI0036C97D71
MTVADHRAEGVGKAAGDDRVGLEHNLEGVLFAAFAVPACLCLTRLPWPVRAAVAVEVVAVVVLVFGAAPDVVRLLDPAE